MRWEYIVLRAYSGTAGVPHVEYQDDRKVEDEPPLNDYLNGMGGDGWEVAGVTEKETKIGGRMVIVMKRRLQ